MGGGARLTALVWNGSASGSTLQPFLPQPERFHVLSQHVSLGHFFWHACPGLGASSWSGKQEHCCILLFACASFADAARVLSRSRAAFNALALQGCKAFRIRHSASGEDTKSDVVYSHAVLLD